VKKERDGAPQRSRTFDQPSGETKFIPKIVLLMRVKNYCLRRPTKIGSAKGQLIIARENPRIHTHHARNVTHIVVTDRIRSVHGKLEIPILCSSLRGTVPLNIILEGESMLPSEDTERNGLTVCQ
jgi:hypothetical protein